MSEVNIGIVTDSHSNGYDSQIAEALRKDNLGCIAYLGDAPSDMRAHPQQHLNEIAQSLQTFDNIGVPVFWIPGNYEDFQAYRVAFQKLEEKLDNVIDVSSMDKSVPFKGFDFVFVPGSSVYTRGFHVTDQAETGDYNTQNGQVHVFNPNDLRKLVQNPDKTVVFAHHPCKIDGDYSIDLAIHANYNGQRYVGPYAHQLVKTGQGTPLQSHQGDEALTRILREIGVQKFFSGDIHEAASIVDIDGNPIKEGQYSRQLFANPGPAKEGDYGIVKLRDDGTASMVRHNVTGNKRDYLSELIR
jgi:Icc-related predicted phosphoesterase